MSQLPMGSPGILIFIESENHIEVDSVKVSRKLLMLNLYKNKIKIIPSGAFAQLAHLTVLDLRDNLMKALGKIVFQGLVSL